MTIVVYFVHTDLLHAFCVIAIASPVKGAHLSLTMGIAFEETH